MGTATKERARRKTAAERAVDKQAKAEYAALKAKQAALPPDPPDDFQAPALTIYELVRPDGTVCFRYLSRRLAHHALLTANSFPGAEEFSVRERVAVLVAPALEFPKLHAGIFSGDELLRTVEFDNPLEEFCRLYNEQMHRISDTVKSAKPLQAEKAVRQ